MSDVREQLRNELLASYKHRMESGCSCAMCGDTTAPLAFHILETSFDEGATQAKTFVPMSSSMGRIRGSYPICNLCAPACKKCQLPIPSEKILELSHKLNARTALGVCDHMQMGFLLAAIFKRLFKIGRFRKKETSA